MGELQEEEIKKLTNKVELQEVQQQEIMQESTRLGSGIAALNERLTKTQREVGCVRSQNNHLVADRENFLAEIRRLKAAALSVFLALFAIVLSYIILHIFSDKFAVTSK